MIKTHPSYVYARRVVDCEINSPKYVIKQAVEFLHVADGEDPKYTIDEHRVAQIDNLLKLFIMPLGVKAGMPIYECSTGYQWLVYVASLAVVKRDDPTQRRYQTVVLEICRKNFKTFTVATMFLLLFFTEPKFSEFYSVAPDGTLSREVREAFSKIIASSPALCGNPDAGIAAKFKVLRDYVTCIPMQSKFTPLAYSTSRMDGRQPNVFLADEVGALPTTYPIEAMRSGQLLLKNKLGFIISTKYPTFDNPFEDEVSYAKKVLDGIIDDETVFALLFEPDKTSGWETDDGILEQANPVVFDNPAVMDDLRKKRANAIERPSARENFVTKHCNIIYQGVGTESYIDVSLVRKCSVEEIDFSGKTVYIGEDLSMSNDNTATMFAAYDSERDVIQVGGMAFIPADKVELKTKTERFDYYEAIKAGECTACGNATIAYDVVEDWTLGIPERFGAKIGAIGYDRYNAISSAQKWETAGELVVEIKQHSSVLHPATKLLSEYIENGKVEYVHNKLLEVNIQNARCVYDTNLNRYVNKKRSEGKVDMVVALINAIYLLMENELLAPDDFGAQW